MYFKIEKTSPLGKRLNAIFSRIKKAHSAIITLAQELSDMDDPRVIGRSFALGVLGGIQFQKHPGREWKKVHTDGDVTYYAPSERVPKSCDLWKKFSSADSLVSDHEFSALFGLESGVFGEYKDGTRRYYSRPDITYSEEYYLVSIADAWAMQFPNRPSDMHEILASEYYYLLENRSKKEHVKS